MSEFKKLVRLGEAEREAGNFDNAREHFQQALQLELTDSEFATVYGHYGLNYLLQNNLSNAKVYFGLCLAYAQTSKNMGQIAIAFRHLSALAIKQGNLSDAEHFAINAYEMAIGMNNLPWFTHGVVKVLFIRKAKRSIILKWVAKEALDLIKIWSKEKNLLAKKVWFFGLLLDLVVATAPIGPWIFAPALLLARKAAQKQQIEKRVEELTQALPKWLR